MNGAINAIAEDNFADARQKAYEADAILESIEREGEEYTKVSRQFILIHHLIFEEILRFNRKAI